MRRRFLVKHQLAPGVVDPRPVLETLADSGHRIGAHAEETFYSAQTGTAFTLFEARDEKDVFDTYARAGLERPEVFPTERIYTDLLDEPRRDR